MFYFEVGFLHFLTTAFSETSYKIFICGYQIETFEPHREKTNVLVSDQAQQKPCCKATEDG